MRDRHTLGKRMWGRRAAAAALALLAGSLVVVSGGTSVAQSSGTQKLTIPIGMIAPVDSAQASFKSNKEALEASVAGFNKRSKDVKFTLSFCDDKNDPNTSADCARQMVSKGVVATVGDIASGNPTAVNQILLDAGIPRVGLSMVGLAEFSSPVSYPLSSGPVLASGGALAQFKKQGITKVSILIQQSPQASAIGTILNPAAKNMGVTLVNTVQIPNGTTDYSSYISAAQADGAQGMDCICTPQIGIPAATAAAQLGSTAPMSLIVLGFSQGDMAQTGMTHWALADSFPPPEQVNLKAFPNLKQFLADMKAAKNPDLAPNKLQGAMEQGWLGLQAISQVTKGMTTVTAASLKSALDAAKDIDMLGIIPPWTPSKPGPSTIFSRVSNPFMYRITWRSGKLVATKQDLIDLNTVFAG